MCTVPRNVLVLSLIIISAWAASPIYARTPLTTVIIKKASSSIVEIEASKDIGRTARTTTFKNMLMRKRITLIKTKTDQFIKSGVGIIIDKRGTIVTNAHTLKDMDRISVRLSNGKSVGARLSAFMPEKDLAFLVIPAAEPLSPVIFADSDKLAVGQAVFTVGRSRFLKGTIIQGKVLALLQSGQKKTYSVDMIQTSFDTRAYQGDSGSPVFNNKGHLVGLLFAAAKEAQKISFAIPANVIRSIYKRLNL